MIKIIITSIIIFIIILLVLLTLNVRIEYFNNAIFITKNYYILKDVNNNVINPIAWYKFEGTGTTLGINSIGGGFNGTPNNVMAETNIFTKGTQSARFIFQNSSYISIPNAVNLDAKSFSICIWVYPLSMSNYNFRMFYANATHNGANRTLHIGYRGTSSVTFDFNSDSFELMQNNNLDLNKWNFYVFTFDNSSNPKVRKVYKNGALVGQNTTRNGLNNSGTKYDIGRYASGSGSCFDGYMNDLRIYSGIVLTDDQIFELYAGYKRIGEVIDTSTNCSVNMNPSGAITEIPDPNMNINVISTITKRNDHIYSQSFGNGTITYNLTFSKYFNDDYIPTNLLSRNNKLTAFTIDNYNNNGDYTGIFTKNLPEELAFGLIKYSQKGEFIHIRLPSSIILKRYGFIADPQWVSRAPGTWALYAGTRLLETSNVNSTLLVNNTTRLNNNSYCSGNEFKYIHDIKDNNTSGNELLFIFPSLASSTSPNNPGRILSFMQLLLFSG